MLVVSLALLLAQVPPRSTETLELRDVYRIAEDQNPRIAAATALANAANARVPSSKRPPDPQFQIGFMNYAVPSARPMDVVGMTQLQVMQMLPTAGKLGLAGRVAELSARAERERARETRWDIRTRVAIAFYDLYAIDRSLSIDRQTLSLLEDALQIAEAIYKVGEGRQADVLRAQLEVGRMVQDTVRMTTMRAAMLARLTAELNGAAVLGTPVLPGFPDSIPSLSGLEQAGLAKRPMLRAGEHDEQAASTSVLLARREIWPDLTVGVQYGQRGGVDGTERMASLMIGTTLPVFARGRQLRMREEAAAMQQMARAELDAMRAETRAAVAEAHATLVRARTLTGLYRRTLLPQAEAASESAIASYRTGAVDFMTLLDNRMSENRYRKELAVLEADEGKAWAELEMLTGQELLGRSPTVAQPERRDP